MHLLSHLTWRHPWTRPVVYPFFSRHPHPIFFLGNQKSGTTAISSLFALAAGKSIATWVPGFSQPILEALWQHRITLPEAIRTKGAIEFSKEVIKECNLTFFHPTLRMQYPTAPMVFIVRDPRENLRSVLSYLQIPGSLPTLLPVYTPKRREWQYIIDNSWMDIAATSYITSMASRWMRAAETYLHAPEQFILIRYEDFQADKPGTIRALCEKLEHPVQKDFEPWLHYPFQPRHPSQQSWETFFGLENLTAIEQICARGMDAFHYPPVLKTPGL